MSQPGSALLASDPLQLGMLLLPQSLAWAEPSALTLDMSRVGVTLPVPDLLQLDSPLLSHSPCQLELVLSVLDFVNPGSMLLVRSGIIGDLTGEITFDNLVGTSLSVSSLSYVGAHFASVCSCASWFSVGSQILHVPWPSIIGP